MVMLLASLARSSAQGTAFTYQGHLTEDGNPAVGRYDVAFIVYDAQLGGTQYGPILTNRNVAVSNGLFTTSLNFGADVFTGERRWLEIYVRTNGNGVFSALNPRQEIAPSPYAIYSANAGTAASALTAATAATAISAETANSALTAASAATANSATTVALQNGAVTSPKIADGTIAASDLNGMLLSNTFWRLGGNAGTRLGHFFGTTDDQPLELRVNGLRALRLEHNGDGAPNLIGGSPLNYIGPRVVGSTIAGGGATNAIIFGIILTNSIRADFGVIGGGAANTIGVDAWGATIAGGTGGDIGTNSSYSAIGGGSNNEIAPNSSYATIAGGVANDIGTNSSYAVIGGGWFSDIGTNAVASTIAGGYWNEIGTDSEYAAIGGGYLNNVEDEAPYATIPGGRYNRAGSHAFAAGYNAQATHKGAFVWSDSTGTSTASTADNSVTFRAGGGYRFFTGTGSGGAQLAAGATAWSVLSDRNVKKDIRPVDNQSILDKLSRVPVTQWHYEWETDSDPLNLGPMAQDFKAAFFPGRDEKSISTLEFDGVALAAIQGLNALLKEKETEIGSLKERLERLERAVGSFSEQNTGGAR